MKKYEKSSQPTQSLQDIYTKISSPEISAEIYTIITRNLSDTAPATTNSSKRVFFSHQCHQEGLNFRPALRKLKAAFNAIAFTVKLSQRTYLFRFKSEGRITWCESLEVRF